MGLRFMLPMSISNDWEGHHSGFRSFSKGEKDLHTMAAGLCRLVNDNFEFWMMGSLNYPSRGFLQGSNNANVW